MVQKKKRLALIGFALLFLCPMSVQACDIATADEGVSLQSFSGISRTVARLEDGSGTSKTKPEDLTEKTEKKILEVLGPRLGIFVLSMLPISELRGALLLWAFDPRTHTEVPWWQASLISLVGNLIPMIPIIFLLDWIMKLLGKIQFIKRFFEWLISRTRRKGGLVERYEYLGLLIFVAIPLPMTGGWTGALLASVLRLNTWKSFVAVSLGILTADVAVTSFVLLKWWGLLAAAIVLPILWFFSRWLEKKSPKTEAAKPKK